MKSVTTLLICVLVSSSSILAQSVNRLSIQAGYLYSTPKLVETSTVLIAHPELKAKPGFYAGLTYEHQLSSLLTSGLELTYQQKGYLSEMNYQPSTNTYRYVSLTPMIGVRLIKNLRFLIGPQVNLLVNKSTSGTEYQPLINASRRVELGLLGRVSYQYNRVGLTASYFKGLTAFYKLDYYYLTNQNWQLGLHYQLNKNKSI